MFPDQIITIQHPNEFDPAGRIDRAAGPLQFKTTWQSFVDHNEPDVIEDVLRQLTGCHYAEIGGGASPFVRVFA